MPIGVDVRHVDPTLNENLELKLQSMRAMRAHTRNPRVCFACMRNSMHTCSTHVMIMIPRTKAPDTKFCAPIAIASTVRAIKLKLLHSNHGQLSS